MIASESNYLAAFLVALLGAVHCFGMCGGIVGALTWGIAPAVRHRPAAMLPYLLAYNAGRLASYTVAGMLAGGVGAWAANLASVYQGQRILQLFAGFFMVLLGLYIGGWWQGLNRVERAGGLLWRCIEPLGRRLLPVRGIGQTLGMGLVWGWLPCGLVYSVLIWAISAGSALQGGLLMLSFGLGTLPALLAMGAFATGFRVWLGKRWVRRVAGVLILGFGGYQLAGVVS